MMHSIQASAPGKLILFGEYAVLEGYPAVVTAVNRRATVKIVPLKAGFDCQLTAPVIGVDKLAFVPDKASGAIFADQAADILQRLHFFRACLQQFLEHYRFPGECHIYIDTLPFFDRQGSVKLGLGSSAALSVALIGALLAASGKQTASADVYRLAQAAHFAAQGKIGSGIDLAAATNGGLIQYAVNPQDRRQPAVCQSLPMPDDLKIRFVWTGASASTTALVQKVNKYRSRDPQGWQAIFAAMGDCAASAITGCQNSDTGAVLAAAREYHKLLSELDRSSEAGIVRGAHEAIHNIAINNNCVYKSSGAGGGDFGILFSDDDQSLNQATASIRQAGYDILPLSPDDRGLNIIGDKE